MATVESTAQLLTALSGGVSARAARTQAQTTKRESWARTLLQPMEKYIKMQRQRTLDTQANTANLAARTARDQERRLALRDKNMSPQARGTLDLARDQYNQDKEQQVWENQQKENEATFNLRKFERERAGNFEASMVKSVNSVPEGPERDDVIEAFGAAITQGSYNPKVTSRMTATLGALKASGDPTLYMSPVGKTAMDILKFSGPEQAKAYILSQSKGKTQQETDMRILRIGLEILRLREDLYSNIDRAYGSRLKTIQGELAKLDRLLVDIKWKEVTERVAERQVIPVAPGSLLGAFEGVGMGAPLDPNALMMQVAP